jgi:hypothetical protein
MKYNKKADPKPLPIRPSKMGGASEAQLEARRRAKMFWFMHKRDQQKKWD